MPMGGTTNLIVKLIGKDQFSRVFDKAEGRMGKLGGMVKKFGPMAAAAGAAFAVGIGVKAVGAAVKFEEEMTNIATLVDTSTESMKDMGDKVKDISKRIPVDIGELTSALYDVRSAGISAGDAMKVLETSGKLAVAGLGTTQEATNLLTSALNVYGDETHNANKLANILFKTVKYGKTTIAELSQGFGKVAAIAKETGISIEDLSGATAILTTGGIKASEAQTALKAMISNILKPTKDAKDVSERLGIQFDIGALQAKGLSGMLKNVADKAGDNKQALADLFGSVEAANAIFALTSKDGGKALDDILKDLNSETDALTEGFDKQRKSTAKQYQTLKNQLNVVMTNLGTKILPYVVSSMDFLVGLFDKGTTQGKAFAGVMDFLRRIFEGIAGAIKGIAGALEKIGLEDFLAKKMAGPVGVLNPELLSAELKRRGLPEMETGGIVPGPRGKPVPTILHGGETVIPAGRGAINNFNFQGAFIGNIEDFKNQIKNLMDRESELKVIGGV